MAHDVDRKLSKLLLPATKADKSKIENLKESAHKGNPLKIASLTPKQLNNLLHPTRNEEQKAAIKVVKARIEKIKNDKNRS